MLSLAVNVLLSFLAIAPYVSSAAEPPPSQQQEAAINAALREREFDRAATLIDGRLSDAPAGEQEFLWYRRGLAFLLAEKFGPAISAFDEQLRRFPDGPWAQKALLRKADAHVGLKQFEQAEQIYARAVADLVGAERKGKLAQVYLDFANEYFKPSEAYLKPDYERARAFYVRALEMEPGDALRDELMVKAADCLRLLGKWGEAQAAYEQYLLAFDADFRAQRRSRFAGVALPPAAAIAGKQVVHARQWLGQCQLAQNQFHEARRTWQDLLALLAKIDPDRKLHDETWIEATYQIAKTHQFPTPPGGEALTLGVETLDRLIRTWPEAPRAIEAAYEIGAAYQHLGRFDDAIAAYRRLIGRDGLRPSGDESVKRAEQLSQQALFAIGQLLAAQKKYDEAIGAWNQYVAKYPTGGQWSAAQQAIVDTEFAIGNDAFSAGEFEPARAAWNAFLQKHPLDGRVPEIMFRFGEMAAGEQDRKSKAGQPADWMLPIAEWRRLVSKFPGTELAGLAQLRVAETFETRLLELETALAEYRKLDWSQHQAAAQQRVAEMNATRLALRTERTFRTDEAAKIHVDVRNIEKLTVKLYKLDMRDYFRRTHALGGVERLDLLLIDPDRTIDVPVDGYARYKPVAQDVEIPFDGPGVFAVNVSNETSTATDAAGKPREKLETTTLLIRSDIDIIVKTSRRQALVFAQDMRTGKPQPGVSVLLSDGAKIRAEGVTGDDGVWVKAVEELKNVGRLAVFAEREGHVAGDSVSLEGLQFSTGLGARGYVYTDRSTYRAGDAVNIRGVLREVKDGQYALPTQPEDPRLRWKLDVVDPGGRVLVTEDIALGEFGTFAAQFRVPEDAPLGGYQLIARRASGPSFPGGFSVQSYELPQAVLRFDFAQPVILRGEAIVGAVVATYNYGEPVARKAVEYVMQLPTGEQVRGAGVTDEKGRVAFEFDSTAMPEEGAVAFSAQLVDLGLAINGFVYVAVNGFRMNVSVPRALYLSEEPVEATIETKDHKGEPIGQEVSITAYLRTNDRGRWAETKIDTATLVTDAKTGVGRATFKLAKGGQYILRAQGKDRHGHAVSAEAQAAISDNTDRTRLRLFSEKQHYRAGDKIALDIHSRIGLPEEEIEAPPDKRPAPRGPVLGLVTFEGEEIIGYRTISLADGHNPLIIPVGNEHFPNFAVGVAVMSGSRFHQAQREFTVERELHVAIKTDKQTYRPRDEMSVELTVTDQQGQPVEAEIGLAMIDDALLSLYPDATANITQFFSEGARRFAAMRTQTSCTFRYAAVARAMETEILAEARRLEEGRAERERAATAGGVPGAAELPALGEILALGRSGIPPADNVSGGADSQPLNTIVEMRDELRAGYVAMQTLEPQQIAAGWAVTNQAAGRAQVVQQRFRQTDANAPGEQKQDQADDANRNAARFTSQLEVDRATAQRGFQQQIDGYNVGKQFCTDNWKWSELDKAINDLVRAAPPRFYFPEVAYWNPRIVTDKAGKATLTIVVPDSSTKWKLSARGVSTSTLAGQGDAEIVSRADFFVELVMPATLMEGDTATPRALVHCLTPYTGKVDVTLKVRRVGDATLAPLAEQTRVAEFTSAGVVEVEFDTLAPLPADRLMFDLSAATQSEVADAKRKLDDASATRILVVPWGMRLENHAAGLGRDSDFVEIDLPAVQSDIRLTVAIGPSVQRWLIEEVLESGRRWQTIDKYLSDGRVVAPRTTADAASNLLACLYVADYVRVESGAAEPSADARQINERISALIGQLLATQLDNGGWPWCGRGGDADPWTTAHVAWALGKARHDGFGVAEPAVQKLAAYLKQVFADAPPTHTELKTIALHGVSWLETADFGHANRLYRNRESLSNAALAHLALVFARLERGSIATELLDVLAKRLKEVRIAQRRGLLLPCEGCSAWMSSELETTGLALLAQLQINPSADNVPALVAYLGSSARADGWRPHKARGPVIAALATYFARTQNEQANFELTVCRNGRELRKISSSDPTGSIRIDLTQADLVDAPGAEPGKQRIDFAFKGRGEYAWAVTYSGFSSNFPDRKTLKNRPFVAEPRHVDPPPREYNGRPIAAGFGVTSRAKSFRNAASNVPVGSVVAVNVHVWRPDRSESPAGDRDYVVVREAIPAGFRLLRESVSGGFAAWDFADNVLTLYYGSRDVGTLSYRMVAATPGKYRVPPTIVRSLYRPEVFTLNDDGVLTVLPRGSESPDPYRLTPDELNALGNLHFEDGHYEEAAKLLKELVDGEWTLREEIYRDAIHHLLLAALQRKVDAEIVDYFEILKERQPDAVIPFEQIVQIAAAYGRTNQHERSYLIYRATADASFVRDSAIAGVLQAEGRFLDSVDLLEKLWLAYPDTPQVESVYYAMSQQIVGQSANAAAVRPRRRDLRVDRPAALQTGVTRAEVLREAIRHVERFLTLYPTSPICDEASYALANAYLELDDFAAVLREAERAAKLYPKSKWFDRYRYVEALAHFNLGSFDKARDLAEQVATATYRDAQGIEQPSPNKWLALYIIGQVYHAQNQFARAIEYYKKVREQFSDAAEAVDVFEHRFVELPEVTVFHPDGAGYREAGEWARALRTRGAPADAPASDAPTAAHSTAQAASSEAPLHARPFVRVEYRNIKSITLQVYRVDLMKLALVEKNLARIQSVDLAGIRPVVEKTVALGDGAEYLDRARPIELDELLDQGGRRLSVAEATGAYLVMCRGDDLFSSGLVLITPLALEVQEDVGSQRTRVGVVDAISRSGVKDVHVKVIGSGMSTFVAGDSDLRGTFIADAVSGFPTAIARDRDGRFAFYRSEGALLAMAPPQQEMDKAQRKAPATKGKSVDYFSNVRSDNDFIQEGCDTQLKQIFNKGQKGVEVQKSN